MSDKICKNCKHWRRLIDNQGDYVKYEDYEYDEKGYLIHKETGISPSVMNEIAEPYCFELKDTHGYCVIFCYNERNDGRKDLFEKLCESKSEIQTICGDGEILTGENFGCIHFESKK